MAALHLIADCQAGITILTSPNMEPMAKQVAKQLRYANVPLDYDNEWVVETRMFSDGELCPTIRPNIRDKVVFLFWDFTPRNFDGDINVRIMELLLVLDAIKHARAKIVNLVMPYFPYSRQDRKMKSRQPISARFLADQLEASKIIGQLITFDLHAPQITGFFQSIHVENIPAHVIFAPFFRKRFKKEIGTNSLQIMSTDVGGSKRARDCATEVAPDLDIAIVDKRRDERGSEAVKIVGAVGDSVIAYDDIGGTMSSMLDACELAMESGASHVYGAITHNVCSPKGGSSAEAKIAKANIPIFTLDTLPRGKEYYRKNKTITRVPYHEFIAAAIVEMVSVGGSVSSLIKHWAKNGS